MFRRYKGRTLHLSPLESTLSCRMSGGRHEPPASLETHQWAAATCQMPIDLGSQTLPLSVCFEKAPASFLLLCAYSSPKRSSLWTGKDTLIKKLPCQACPAKGWEETTSITRQKQGQTKMLNIYSLFRSIQSEFISHFKISFSFSRPYQRCQTLGPSQLKRNTLAWDLLSPCEVRRTRWLSWTQISNDRDKDLCTVEQVCTA